MMCLMQASRYVWPLSKIPNNFSTIDFLKSHNFILIKITIDLIVYNRLFIKIIKAFLKI